LQKPTTTADADKARYLPCVKNEFISSEESITDDSDMEGDSDSDADAPKPRVLCIRLLP